MQRKMVSFLHSTDLHSEAVRSLPECNSSLHPDALKADDNQQSRLPSLCDTLRLKYIRPQKSTSAVRELLHDPLTSSQALVFLHSFLSDHLR